MSKKILNWVKPVHMSKQRKNWNSLFQLLLIHLAWQIKVLVTGKEDFVFELKHLEDIAC